MSRKKGAGWQTAHRSLGAIGSALVRESAVLALGLVSSAGATPPGANGRIAYSAIRDGNPELYSIAPDGSSERRLTWTNATRPSGAPFYGVEVADLDGDGTIEILGSGGAAHSGSIGEFVGSDHARDPAAPVRPAREPAPGNV